MPPPPNTKPNPTPPQSQLLCPSMQNHPSSSWPVSDENSVCALLLPSVTRQLSSCKKMFFLNMNNTFWSPQAFVYRRNVGPVSHYGSLLNLLWRDGMSLRSRGRISCSTLGQNLDRSFSLGSQCQKANFVKVKSLLLSQQKRLFKGQRQLIK